MVYSLKQRHSVLWIFHATHHVKETTNNDRCNISLNKCPHSNKHPLAKKNAHPQGYKVKQASHKEEPSPPPYTWKTCFYCHFIYNSFKSFNYSKVSTGVPLDLVPSF